MKPLIAIPIVVLVFLGVFWVVGGFDEKVETPDIPTVPDVPDIPTIPTTPLCIDQLYVEIYKIDIGHQVEEEHIPVLIFEGLLNCDIIEEYKKDPTLEIKYPNNMTITTTWDANTNGWQKGYEA